MLRRTRVELMRFARVLPRRGLRALHTQHHHYSRGCHHSGSGGGGGGGSGLLFKTEGRRLFFWGSSSSGNGNGNGSENGSGSGNGSGNGSENGKRQHVGVDDLDLDLDLDLNAMDSDAPIGGTQLLKPGDIPAFPHVTALPLSRRPLFPGTYYPLEVHNHELAEHLLQIHSQGSPYVGAFLQKEVPPGAEEAEEGKEGQSTYMDSLWTGITSLDQIYSVGMLAQINRMQRLPTGGLQVILLGHRRISIEHLASLEPVARVKVEHFRPDDNRKARGEEGSELIRAYTNEIMLTMKEILRYNPVFKEQLQLFLSTVDLAHPGRLADVSASLTSAAAPELQKVIEAFGLEERMSQALVLLKKELEISKLQQEISKKVEEKVSENHRRFLLHEQLKNIKRELGMEKDDKEALASKFTRQLGEKGVPEEAQAVIDEELAKLSTLEQASSEFNMTRNYLDWLTSLPWGVYSRENFDISRAQEILDRDHYGLEDVKNRILEFIAVGKLLGTVPQGKIVCLVGPPGVGKTSIGRSIADSLNREFYRFSVGGLYDVAEIKGHRRTYVGAMPGKLIQCLKKTQASNPVVMIDEIDKIGTGHRGDPSSALLEVLDPSQNSSFMDHYLDVPVDLSRVLFICTANMTDTIPGPLADRMEFIRLSGYIMQEKLQIAKSYLAPAALKETGLTEEDVALKDDTIMSLVRWYCREAGVRNLQKHINQIYRKAALHLVREHERALVGNGGGEGAGKPEVSAPASQTFMGGLFSSAEAKEEAKEEEGEEEGEKTSTTSGPSPNKERAIPRAAQQIEVTSENLIDYVGKPLFTSDRLYEHTPVGVVMGLAFNQLGGATLYIETTVVDSLGHEEEKAGPFEDEIVIEGPKEKGAAAKPAGGSGSLHVTGQLGDVMRESSQIAYTVAKGVLRRKAPGNRFFQANALHMHVPEGATPKDGPSAGVTMVTSLLSLALGKQVRKDLAMTGEITLTGRVLPIGGVREKAISAKRENASTLIFPRANQRDYEELPEIIRDGIEAHFAETYDEVYDVAFSSSSAEAAAPGEDGS